MSSKENCSTRNEDNVKLLEIHINNNLTFDYHVNQLCKKASEKRLLHLINFHNALVMFHSKKMEHRINSIYKRALKSVYQNSHDLTFEELLAKYTSVSDQISVLTRCTLFSWRIH